MEIALVIGIVLGAVKKTGRSALGWSVWSGAGVAAALSAAIAVVLTTVGVRLEGRAEEIFEGSAMLLAAGVLTWMIFWMQRQSRNLKGDLEAGVRRAAGQAGGWGLFSLAFLAVFREGVELALFLTAAALASQPLAALGGALLGLAASALLGWALFSTVMRLNLRTFFLITSALLILFAAGLAAHGVHEFNEAGVVPAVIEHVWDVNHLIDEDSAAGALLTTLFGYNGNPSLTEVIAYWVYLLLVSYMVARERLLPARAGASTA